MWTALWSACVLYAICGGGALVASSVTREDGEVRLFRSSDSFDVETTVMLNDEARTDKEVAYKVQASLLVEPVWTNSDNTELLLKFELEDPHLLSRGKHVNADFLRLNSVWDSYPHSAFYAQWNRGIIETSYLDLNEVTDIVNYKRSLISLFQFQLLDGESTETDISGTCNVLYETLSSDVVRKIKSGCEENGLGGTRRVTRYTLDAGGVRELHAEEVHAGAGLKARAWSRLRRSATRPAAPRVAPTEPPAPPAPLTPAPLHAAPPHPAPWPNDDLLQLEGVMAGGQALWEAGAAGAGGGAAQALAALRVLPALCAAPAPRLAALLHDQRDPDTLRALVSALGSCGAAGAHAAVTALLQLARPAEAANDAPALPGLAADYLAALALAPAPEDSVVEDVLKLGAWPAEGDAEAAGLAEAALLAGAAAARRAAPRRSPALRRLRAALGLCPDDACRAVHLCALGNLGSADSADDLLQWAESGSAGVAGAALDALDGLPPAALQQPTALHRLEHVVLSGKPLAVRAAALDLVLRLSAPAPFGLTRLAHELRHAPVELRRVLWQRLRALADEHADVALLLQLLPPDSAHELAPGTSSVLRRAAGAARLAGAAWRAELDSLQLASAGVLRRGRVGLVTVAPDNSTDDTLTVELQASGLESFAGGDTVEGEGEESEEGVAAALHFRVGGARLPPVRLFSGQGELLRLVWAGVGSEPTPAVRALRPLLPAEAALRLLDGATLRLRRHAAAAFALDAHAQVSLWSRSARAELELRVGVAMRSEIVVRAAWGELSAARHAVLEPRLRISADLDFYDGVALCVRPRLADAPLEERLALRSVLGEGGRGVRRRRRAALALNGRSLALGALNDAACRALPAADD